MNLQRVSALTSGALLVAAGAVLVAPLPQPVQSIRATIEGVESRITIVAVIIGLSTLIVIARQWALPMLDRVLLGSNASGRSTRPKQATTTHEIAGGDMEASLERLREGSDAVPARTDRQRVRERLIKLAVKTIATRDDCSRSAAIEQVAAGTWTDDPRAAAFLADDERPPLDIRIEDWLFGPPIERRARAAIAEIAALRTIETEVEQP